MKGLVLSGGGASGCFTAGVLYRLFGEVKFSRIYGTSAGALNAALLAQSYVDKSPEIIKDIWTNRIRKNKNVYKMSYFRLVSARPPISFKPLKKLIDEVADFDAISKLDEEFITTSVDLLCGRTNYFSNKEASPEVFKDALIASASVPFFAPPIELMSKVLVDGGIRENAPVRRMLSKKDIDDILVILTGPIEINKIPHDKAKSFRSSLKVLIRSIEIMMGEITLNDLKSIRNINNLLKEMNVEQIENNNWLRNKKIIDVSIVLPDRVIVEDLLEFDQRRMIAGFDRGVMEAQRYLRYGAKEIDEIDLKLT